MYIIDTIEELHQWRQTVGQVALVPTMGNLHEGHLSLVERAKQETDNVVVSVFVNRIQFGKGEDFEHYPRTLVQDAEKLRAAGVAVLFAPSEEELYPTGQQHYFVEPPALQHDLCGAFRPSHFRGVTTVVTKLLNIVQPDVACFGQKDFQQFVILKNMVADLNMNVRMISVPIVRAEDGLALSSRNQYLNATERAQAIFLYQQLQKIEAKLRSGSRDFAALAETAKLALSEAGWRVDYVTIREAQTLRQAKETDKELVVLAAAYLGNTRLIDNIHVVF